MANSTIYPYGQNGELPSNIGLVNDLITGGVDKALTGEMGKVIGESLENCFNGLPEKTHLSNGDLINATVNWGSVNYRIISKQSALIDVDDFVSFSLHVPYSAILDSNIDRVLLALFNSSKTYITGTQYDSWTLFNGQDVTITADKGSSVRYIGVYLGSASTGTSISPSNIDATKIEFSLVPAISFGLKSKAVSEEMTTSDIVEGSNKLITSGAVASILPLREEFTLTGNGSNFVGKQFSTIPGLTYRINISPTNFDTTGISNGINICSLEYISNGSATPVFVTYKGSNVVHSTYTFTSVEADYYSIGIRAASGVEVDFELIRVTTDYVDAVPTENSEKLITSGGVYDFVAPIKSALTKDTDLSDFTCSWSTNTSQSSGYLKTRYRCAISVPKIPITVKVEGVPSGYYFALQSNLTISDALSSEVQSVESAGYWFLSDGQYTFNNTTAKVVCVGFKIGSAGTSEFTQSDMDALQEAVSVTFTPWIASGGSSGGTDIISLNDERQTTRYLTNLKRPNISNDGQYTDGLTPFTLLHFSDLHADSVNLKRIMQWKEHYSSFIDDAICTGDIIRNKYGDDYSFWSSNNADSVLVSTGNHEYYNGESSAYYTQITPKQVYDKFFAPYISEWGTVIFPTNASTEGYNYYYKDYSSQKIRLVVLDNMANMSATRNNVQSTWLATVLEDARQNGLHVICAIHIGSTIVTPFDTPFFAMRTIVNSDGGVNAQTYAEFYTLRDAVETFIDNGGHFVCWIGGHKHSDEVAVLTGYKQGCIHVATAAGGDTQRNVDGHVWWIIPRGDDCSRADDTKSQDCFNIYSVDTEKGMLRLFRAGNDLDRYGRHKGMLVYDYFNRQVIYSN